ncbi:very short patch repair endonuclease [Tsuneonella sp. HG249]
MADIVDPETRSRMMAGIRGRNTRPELALRHALHAAGYRYRLHRRDLPGSPDLVFSQYRAVIFVNGCFWHRHEGCRFATTPATRTEFWQQKFDANVERDVRNRNELSTAGWRTGIVWECSLKTLGAEEMVTRVADWLKSSSEFFEA